MMFHVLFIALIGLFKVIDVVDLPERIVVVNDKKQFISYSHPARVRKLLKEKRAEIIGTDPFTIRLKGEKGKVMTPMKPAMITNFTDFFKGEEKDIYVMNLSNTQLSFEVEVSPGRVIPILIPRTRNPYNLTQHVPFAALKNCPDIRKLANRRPPALKLLTHEEFMEYYAKLAKQFHTTPEEEIEKALEMQAGLLNKTAYVADEEAKTIDALRAEKESDPEALVEAKPHPKVIGLCSQVGPDVDKNHKLSARDFIAELELMGDTLKSIDFEYVASHGYYNMVKKWANQKMGAMVSESEDSEE